MENAFDKSTCDFSGWATRNDLLCGDGRTIRKDAFKHNDGEIVPIFWNHQQNMSRMFLVRLYLKIVRKVCMPMVNSMTPKAV